MIWSLSKEYLATYDKAIADVVLSMVPIEREIPHSLASIAKAKCYWTIILNIHGKKVAVDWYWNNLK
jgi:hypothetical protein